MVFHFLKKIVPGISGYKQNRHCSSIPHRYKGAALSGSEAALLGAGADASFPSVFLGVPSCDTGQALLLWRQAVNQ
jgi:hypothetical protein